MKTLLSVVLLIGSLNFWIVGCTSAQTEGVSMKKADTTTFRISLPVFTIPLSADSITDSRDGETYATVIIGGQTWMAENLRYKAARSRLNPDNPSTAYGRLYDGNAAQTACPEGWHLPSDWEWNQMEMALGMSPVDTAKTFWRGAHGAKMKSIIGWAEAGENGTNSSGFNGLPAGYYFSDGHGSDVDLGGLGSSGGFWSSSKGSSAWIRFLGAPLKGVNRFENEKSSGFEVACRCVKD